MSEPAEVEAFPCSPRMFSAAEFDGRVIKPRPMLVPGLIPGRQVSTIDGEGGGGKSTLGLQLCAAAVTGRSWLDQPVQRGPAIYLASEDDEDEIQRRLDAIALHLKVGFADLADLHVWPLAADDPALVRPGKDDGLEPTARWSQLRAAVDRIRPVVLVLDSRADVFAGNEISRAQARGFIAMLRGLAVRQGVAVVLLSHPSLAGMSSGSGSSGSTHWRNAVRAGLYLKRSDDPDASPDLRVLELVKSNYSAAGFALSIRWSAGAFVLEEGCAAGGKKEAAAAVDETFMRLLVAYNAQGRPVSDLGGRNYAPALFARDPDRCGATKDGFTAAMTRLFKAGRVRAEETGPPARRRRELRPVAVEGGVE